MSQTNENTPVTVIVFEGTDAEIRLSFDSAFAAYNWIYANDYYEDARLIAR